MTVKQYKIVFLGDSSVGKTSLIARFMYDTFDANYQPTVGIDFLSKTVAVDDRTIKLHLWDTAGQERFRALIPSYLRDAAAAVVLYDITNRASFDHIEKWVDDVRSERGSDCTVMIVGAKSDLSPSRVVSVSEGQQKAQDLETLWSEASAKSGEHVKTLFRKVALSLPFDRIPANDDRSKLQVESMSDPSTAQSSSGGSKTVTTENGQRRQENSGGCGGGCF
ncbi:putative GTP-binding protein ryh1 [Blattamonas nauphoetae]|uniref:GTP-binding protein ryh1 n=1 Tax=Blattamonas nauphoetae TaxID=2049346 RepID=A0ABQ9WV39_9EUKA|nr:putative GTP-binding protein ryh1 [Blattamonas nauphoetae]